MGLMGKAKDSKPELMAQALGYQGCHDGLVYRPGSLKKGKQMIHFNGTYHSDANNGIIHYLKEYRPKDYSHISSGGASGRD